MRETAFDRYFEELNAELAEERATGLTKAGRAVEATLDRCAALARDLPTTSVDERAAVLDAYAEARREFDHALWAYCVHREAIGLHDHRWVHRVYVAPPTVAELEQRAARAG